MHIHTQHQGAHVHAYTCTHMHANEIRSSCLPHCPDTHSHSTLASYTLPQHVALASAGFFSQYPPVDPTNSPAPWAPLRRITLPLEILEGKRQAPWQGDVVFSHPTRHPLHHPGQPLASAGLKSWASNMAASSCIGKITDSRPVHDPLPSGLSKQACAQSAKLLGAVSAQASGTLGCCQQLQTKPHGHILSSPSRRPTSCHMAKCLNPVTAAGQ